jgi:hypothetical protein
MITVRGQTPLKNTLTKWRKHIMTTVMRGLDNILSGGTEFITFEEGKPRTLLVLDWYENLSAIREHYEPSLNPKYIRCPGKEVCPLCAANPGKYPALRIKFRVFDPADSKVKLVSLAKSHIQKLNADFNLDEVDPTKAFVTIYRVGKGATDTSYSARQYKPNPEQGKPVYEIPVVADLDIPDLSPQLTPHSPDDINAIMNALIAGVQGNGNGQGGYNPNAQQGYNNQGNQGGQANQGNQQPANDGSAQQGAPANQRKLPF